MTKEQIEQKKQLSEEELDNVNGGGGGGCTAPPMKPDPVCETPKR